MRSVMSVSVLMFAVFAMACGANAFNGPAAIDGTWSEDFTIAGNSTSMLLSSSSSNISGSGQWAGEAGPSGTLAVTGTIEGVSVHLDMTFTETAPRTGIPPTIRHFDGQFTSPNALKGTLTTDAPGQPTGHISFSRVT